MASKNRNYPENPLILPFIIFFQSLLRAEYVWECLEASKLVQNISPLLIYRSTIIFAKKVSPVTTLQDLISTPQKPHTCFTQLWATLSLHPYCHWPSDTKGSTLWHAILWITNSHSKPLWTKYSWQRSLSTTQRLHHWMLQTGSDIVNKNIIGS